MFVTRTGEKNETSMRCPEVDPFAEIARQTTQGYADKLLEQLRDMIVGGKLPAGYVFPNENTLCARLAVGRSTLREAYKVLDALGYITRTKNGTVVNDVERLALDGAFGTMLELSQCHELIELILLLEPQAAGMAATRATTAELESIRECLEFCEGCAGNLADLEVCNRTFHARVRRAAHNRLVTSAISASFEAFERCIIRNVYRPGLSVEAFIESCLHQHRKLYEALEKRDSRCAEEVARNHLECDVDRVRRLLAEKT